MNRLLGKITDYRLQITVMLFLLLSFYFLLFTSTHAQTCIRNNQAEGLISAGATSGRFGNDKGVCVIGNQALYAPFKIPTYDELKSLFFTQAKQGRKITSTNNNFSTYNFDGGQDFLVNITTTLNVSGNPLPASNGRTAIVFVENDLNINQNLTYGGGGYGLVFVVRGNINIASTVSRVDAVLISTGKIYTAGAGCTTNTVLANSSLTVNGSLIALNRVDPDGGIAFCRDLTNNSSATEVVNWQPKYLVILKNLFSETLTVSKQLN